MLSILILLVLAMAIAPETPFAKACRHWLVDAPARLWVRAGRGIMLSLVVVSAVLAVVALLGHDAGPIALFSTPEAITWLGMVDLGTFADIIVAVVLISPALRVRAIKRVVAAFTRPFRARSKRAPRRPRPDQPANDDDRPATPARAA